MWPYLKLFWSVFSRIRTRKAPNTDAYHAVYLPENALLFKKQLGFQSAHLIEYDIFQLVNQISKAFDKNKFILGIFIDLNKTPGTFNHDILINKLDSYGVRIKIWNDSKSTQLSGFRSILSRSNVIWRFKRRGWLKIMNESYIFVNLTFSLITEQNQ